MIILVLGKTDQDRNAEDLVTNLRDCGLDAVAQSRMEQEILRRIAANTEFGEDNKVRALLVTGQPVSRRSFGVSLMSAIPEDFINKTSKLSDDVTRPFPNSKKIYVEGSRKDILVPMREVAQAVTQAAARTI